MEGVMIRGPGGAAVAVRSADGAIVVDGWPAPAPALAMPWRLPVLRGLAALADGLVWGTRALLYSAERAAGMPGPEAGGAPGGSGLGWSVAVSLTFAIGLFVVLPAAVAGWVRPFLPSAFAAGLFEGVLRLALLTGYVAVLGALPEVGRMLQFHGAEHKAIAALEAGLPLDVGAAARCSRFHPRCGTSFLLFVLLLCSILYSLLGWQAFWVRIGLRVALFPLLAGVGFEFLRASAGPASGWRRIGAAPGLWLQRFTTREPEASHLEVALAALRRALALRAPGDGRAPPPAVPVP